MERRSLSFSPLRTVQCNHHPIIQYKNDKFNILGEPFRSKGNNPDETIGELVQRRLGISYLHYAVDPFISGVYAGDPMRLVTRHALPKLYQLEQTYGSFILGGIAKSFSHRSERRPVGYTKSFLYLWGT